jgi:hypothetical protein
VDTIGLAPHFDGTCYSRWKVLMEAYLQTKDLDVWRVTDEGMNEHCFFGSCSCRSELAGRIGGPGTGTTSCPARHWHYHHRVVPGPCFFGSCSCRSIVLVPNGHIYRAPVTQLRSWCLVCNWVLDHWTGGKSSNLLDLLLGVWHDLHVY